MPGENLIFRSFCHVYIQCKTLITSKFTLKIWLHLWTAPYELTKDLWAEVTIHIMARILLKLKLTDLLIEGDSLKFSIGSFANVVCQLIVFWVELIKSSPDSSVSLSSSLSISRVSPNSLNKFSALFWLQSSFLHMQMYSVVSVNALAVLWQSSTETSLQVRMMDDEPGK